MTTVRDVDYPDTRPRATAVQERRARPVVGFAIVGVAFMLLQVKIYGSWILSGDAVRIRTGSGELPSYMQVSITIFQIVSPLLALVIIYKFLVKPWRREGHITLDGLFVMLWPFMYWQDPVTNWSSGWFTYNSGYLNLGAWTMHVPGWMMPNQNRLPEPILNTMTLWFWGLFGSVVVANWAMRKAKTRWPQLGNVGLVSGLIAVMILLDVLGELFFMTLAGAWTFPGAIPWLTLFHGKYYQFPMNEAIFWGLAWAGFACLRFFKNDKGQILCERGIDELRVTPKKKQAIRFLALVGIGNLIFLVYTIPNAIIALNSGPWPDDIKNRPYFNTGICGKGTNYACPGPDTPVFKPGSAGITPDGKIYLPEGTKLPD